MAKSTGFTFLTSLALSFFLLGGGGCKSAISGESARAMFVRVPLEDINLPKGTIYRDWSFSSQARVRELTGYSCVTVDAKYLQIPNYEAASAVLHAFNSSEKATVLSVTASEIQKMCDNSGRGKTVTRKIRVRLTGKNLANEFLKDTSLYNSGLYSVEFLDVSGDGVGEIDLIYPQKYRYISEDYNLMLSLLQKRIGADCCTKENEKR